MKYQNSRMCFLRYDVLKHGEESCGILYVYSGRTSKKTDLIHYEFSWGKVHIPYHFCRKPLNKSYFHVRCLSTPHADRSLC